MESRNRAAQAVTDGARVSWRFRLVACCLALTALAFAQSSGRIVTDTKLDLTINPGGFLARALSLWDPQGGFGQVQNQAYGYLFPMGPFFELGHLIKIDPWVVQRLWWALVLCVAFVGFVKLAGELGVQSQTARLIGGFAFALSPRIMTVIGPSSIEAWPSAVAPWVLLPLVIGLRRGNPTYLAAMSGLAVGVVGGVNAAATFAVIPLGAWWLLSSSPGPRRRRLMWWWPTFVALGTLWWLLPLVLLGRYSPPFLDYIESSSVTTVVSTVFDAMRGTTAWVPYLSTESVAGNQLISQSVLIMNGAVILLLGIAGLALRTTPHRSFLIGGVLIGLVFVTAGHVGAVDGIAASNLRELLDGVLSPLRNTHKFDVLIRLPLVLGLAHALSAALRPGGRERAADAAVRGVGVTVLAGAALIGSTVPAWTGHLAPEGSFTEIPGYWQQTSDWLGDHETGTALLVPSTAFPDYLWGRTGDEPLQPLATQPWGIRNSIPLADSGNIRFLDSVTRQLDSGVSAAGLADTLRRAGVSTLVVRNDLDTTRTGTNVEATYAALEGAPGIKLAAAFGPTVGADPVDTKGAEPTFFFGGWLQRHKAVEIYQVEGATNVRTQLLDDTPTVIGNADTLASLDELGILAGQSVLLAPDQNDTPSSLVLTDGNRRQEAVFGTVHANRSGSLAKSEPYAASRRVHDYQDDADKAWEAVPEMRGASKLAASSSRSDADSAGGTRPLDQPWSAFDGDRRSSWRAQTPTGWISLGWKSEHDLGTVTLRAGQAPGIRQVLTVTTSDGPVHVTTLGSDPVTVDVGSVKTLRISGTADEGVLSLADVSSPTLNVSRPLVLPEVPEGWGKVGTIALGTQTVSAPGCLEIEAIVRCRSGSERLGEDAYVMDRELRLDAGADYTPTIDVLPIAGRALDRLLQTGSKAVVSSSSAITRDARNSVSRVVDGDLRTGWIADPSDAIPVVTMTFDSPQRLSHIEITSSTSVAASRPNAVVLELDGGEQRRVALSAEGVGEFPEATTKSVRIALTSTVPAIDLDPLLGGELPVGFAELSFGTADEKGTSSGPLELPCGTGPTVTVDGIAHQSRLVAQQADLAAGRPATATLCGSQTVHLSTGISRVQVRASDLARATSVVLHTGQPSPPVPAANGSAPLTGSTNRTIFVRSWVDDSIAVLGENLNAGWKADARGKKLDSIRVNGWQQGWVVPTSSGTTLKAQFGPQKVYAAGLAIGGLAALSLLAMVLTRRRYAALAPDASRRRPVWLGASLAVVATLLFGSWPVLIATVVGAAGAWAVRRRPDLVVALAVIPTAAAAGLYVFWPWGGSHTWAGDYAAPQLLVGLTLGALVGALLFDRQDLSRMNGISTTR